MLKTIFTNLLAAYNPDSRISGQLWAEIEKSYSHKKRHYHTLQHLTNMLWQLDEVKDRIQDWDTVLFALFYHDIIYNSLRSDNEEKSAAAAEKSMTSIALPANMIGACKKMIMATAGHARSEDADTNYFTDADLAVLGADWETYTAYYQDIRKEYSIYPDLVYKPGRKKVLTHFLAMESIYKTGYFFSKFEAKAKQNMKKELELLC